MSFYNPEEVRSEYDRIIPVYQTAFAGSPWNERSKCPDPYERCVGGLSQLAIGQQCDICELCPSRPAYEPSALAERFDELATSRPTQWYLEESEKGLTMAAIAWRATSAQIAREKYPDVPVMKDWLQEKLGDKSVVWLDEVFADHQLKPSGNLANFATICQGFSERLGETTIAYRTISPQMIRAAQKLRNNSIM